MIKPDDYTIAVYIRLSSEDDDVAKGEISESNSIKNQRGLLMEFVENKPEFKDCKVLEFCDDGHSGKDFERPSIKKLLELTRAGRIHCVVVKDFSRFGRNKYEVGDYLEQIFPFLGVRFISVNENYDSNRFVGSTAGIDVSFKFFMDEFYLSDLSAKVRAGVQVKMKKGEFLSPFAIFGYKKSAKQKNRMEIDKTSSVTVRQIFDLAISGKKTTEIAQILNNQRTPTPSEYHKITGSVRNWDKATSGKHFWNRELIRKILTDERYTGVGINGRFRRNLMQKSVVVLPKSDWFITPNCHEAIVTKLEFKKAQECLIRTYETVENLPRILYNKVKCHACSRTMHRMGGQAPYYACHTLKFTDKYECVSERIPESLILETLMQSIKMQIALASELDSTHLSKGGNRRISDLKARINKYRTSVEQLNVQKQLSYEDFKDGKIAKEDFLRMKASCSAQIADITANLDTLIDEVAIMNEKLRESERIHGTFGAYINLTDLSRGVVDALVDKIVVYDAFHFEIVWNYKGHC